VRSFRHSTEKKLVGVKFFLLQLLLGLAPRFDKL